MGRWKDRLHRNLGGNPDDLFDFAIAFFATCYHLRDWLACDVPSLRSELDALFLTSAPLRVAADISNITKHFDLTNPPRAGRQLSLAREYEPTRGWFGPESRLVILSSGNKTDVLQLVTDCEGAWQEFLSKHGLL